MFSSWNVHKILLFTKSSCCGQKLHKSVKFAHDLETLLVTVTWTVVTVGAKHYVKIKNFRKKAKQFQIYLKKQFMPIYIYFNKDFHYFPAIHFLLNLRIQKVLSKWFPSLHCSALWVVTTTSPLLTPDEGPSLETSIFPLSFQVVREPLHFAYFYKTLFMVHYTDIMISSIHYILLQTVSLCY